MPREDLPAPEAREGQHVTAPVALLVVAIALILLARLAWTWLRQQPPPCNAGSPPPALHFCGRDYRDPHRILERLPSDPTAIEPMIEAVDGYPLRYRSVHTTHYNGADVCSMVRQTNDARGWVAHSMVGGL